MSSDRSRVVNDPVCGAQVDTLRARAVGIFGGVTYYFCSAECKAKFHDPRKSPRAEARTTASEKVASAGATRETAAEPRNDSAAPLTLSEEPLLPARKTGVGWIWLVAVAFSAMGALLFYWFRH